MTDTIADPDPDRDPDPDADPTPPRRPRETGPVRYRGEELRPERGPGLGCFRFQLAVLAVFVVLTPLSVSWGWSPELSAVLLFVVIALLLVTGQTIIFLLRLVAADRRGRRRPLASDSRTVGELEASAEESADSTEEPTAAPAPADAPSPAPGPAPAPAESEGPVRQ